MELLIALLIAIGVFGNETEAEGISELEMEEVRHEYHEDLVDNHGEEYTNIWGTDLNEVE